jgi:pimeloyl-ACP methyl ester carboxylesterase
VPSAMTLLAAFLQILAGEPHTATFLSSADGSTQRYAISLPRTLDPERRYPLFVVLHDQLTNHEAAVRRAIGRAGGRAGRPTAALDAIVASPLARAGMGYRGLAERDVYDLVDHLKRRHPVDEDRVYLTGSSLGAAAALRLALTHPDVWAAVAPVSLLESQDVEELAANASNLAVHLFHGEQDAIAPARAARAWHKRLAAIGSAVDYTEFPFARHNAWDAAYRNGALFASLGRFRRERFPARVHLSTRHYRSSAAYWVTLDALAPGTLAAIDARFLARNEIEIATSALEGFTLNLAGHPQFAAAAPVAVRIDGALLRAKSAGSLSFVRDGSGWKQGRAAHPEKSKRPGAEGPIAAAFDTRHSFIYGSGISEKAAAEAAARWQPGARVLADHEATGPAIETQNLILFGTKRTNSLIARFAPRLPLELNAGAADYGLFFVTSIGGRYIAVSSGLPWWLGSADARRPYPRFAAPVYREMLTFADYVLFKGSLENVVAEGFFDRNWSVPLPAAMKMRESGAVVIP